MICALVFAGLVLVLLQSLHLALWQVEATMNPMVNVDGRMVRVTGTTDLPDGAVIDYYYVHQVQALQGKEPDGGVATVRDGRFQFDTDFADWPGGAVVLYTGFSVGWGLAQPQAVVDRFGSEGELLGGPQAYVDSPGDPPRLSATTTFELPPDGSVSPQLLGRKAHRTRGA